jgi:hypothetical protein
MEIKLEYISGIPLFYLYKNKLLTNKHIDDLFEILSNFHSYKNTNLEITKENVLNNYVEKLKKRFNVIDYPFINSEKVFKDIIDGIQENYSPIISNMIHGDFWFSNIILAYDDKYKIIDMKGQVDNILTINGDIYYDYGKLYQSILGYDLLLNNLEIDTEYINKMKKYFIEKCENLNLNLLYLKYVTKSLIFGTFHFMNEDDKSKEKIWNLIDKGFD